MMLMSMRRSGLKVSPLPSSSGARLRCRAVGRLCAVAALSVAATTGPVPAAHGSNEDSKPKSAFNVLLVSVDTLRADHLGCYGHPTIKTPNLDGLAAEGTRFAQCISSSPLTLPSHASMMTGSYPFVHGARDNGSFTLSDANETLAERLKQAGYTTHAEVAAIVLNERYGLAQGFDSYGDVATVAETKGEDVLSRKLPPLPNQLVRTADEITKAGIELLRQNQAKRFFIFLHYFDPHREYAPPEPFAGQYENGYLGEIAFVDAELGKLFGALDSLGLDDNTLVIVTSDHGEGRGDHGEDAHSFFLYDSTQHVPLVMRCPGVVPAGKVVSSQVRLIDIPATVLDLAGVEQPPQMQGASLQPLFKDPAADLELACYGDTMTPKYHLGYSALRFLRADGWKYILSPGSELYHVAEDPEELVNLAVKEPERAATMRAELRSIIAQSPAPPGTRLAVQAVEPEELSRLRALGYTSGGSPDVGGAEAAARPELDDFEPKGPNPADQKDVLRVYSAAQAALGAGNLVQAEQLLREILEKQPSAATVAKKLGAALFGQHRIEAAIIATRQAVHAEPNDASALAMLGELLKFHGDHKAAINRFREALQWDPDSFRARKGLADLLSQQKNYTEAMAHYTAAAHLKPEDADTRLNWGVALHLAGDLEAAEQQLRKAVELNPELMAAVGALATTLHDRGKMEEAVQLLAKIVETHPDDPALRQKIASWYAAKQDHGSAVEHLTKMVKLQPRNANAYYYRGVSYLAMGKLDEAIADLRKASSIDPNSWMSFGRLGDALARAGRYSEAVEAYQRVVKLKPRKVAAYHLLARLQDAAGDARGALESLRIGRAAMPDDVSLAHNLAWRLATASDADLRDGAEAVKLLEQIRAVTSDPDAALYDTLAAAYAEAGRYEDAVATARKALDAATAASMDDLAARIKRRLNLYEDGRPYHEPAKSP